MCEKDFCSSRAQGALDPALARGKDASAADTVKSSLCQCLCSICVLLILVEMMQSGCKVVLNRKYYIMQNGLSKQRLIMQRR